jgi:ATP-dependent phosphofructokinase / diphosphate-dependent phosphofructokinase
VDGELNYLDFTSLQDPSTGKTRVRSVGITKPTYKVAREYMIRLEREDFADDEKLRLLGQAASSKDKLCSPDEFKSRYQYLATELLGTV